MKATGQYFPVVLFIVRYKVVSTSEFVDETLKYMCDHSTQYSSTKQRYFCAVNDYTGISDLSKSFRNP